MNYKGFDLLPFNSIPLQYVYFNLLYDKITTQKIRSEEDRYNSYV